MMPKQPNQPFIHYSIFGFMAFGVVLGAAIGGNENSGFFEFIKNWNALIGSTVAIFAAWIALGNSTRQIATTIQIKQDELYRENLAARAALNIVLSDICRYSRLTIECIEERLHSVEPESPIPELDSNTIQVLEKNIRFGIEPQVGKIAKLTSDLQVQRARIEGHERNGDLSEDRYAHESIYDALEIYTQASNLFNYSRFHESNDHGMSIHSALSVNARYKKNRDPIKELIVGRIGEEVRPAADASTAGQ